MKGIPCPWSKNPELQCVSKLEVSTWLGPGPQQSCKRCRIGVLKSQGQPGFKKAEDAKEQTQTDKQKKNWAQMLGKDSASWDPFCRH